MRKRGLNYYLKLILFLPIAFIIVIWVIGAYRGFVGPEEVLHPKRNIFCCGTPSDDGYEFEDVTLVTEDGLTLVGWYLPSTNGRAIIMAHGIDSNRMQMWRLGHLLNDNGYGVLLFDLRAHGESEGKIYSKGWLDILAGVVFLQAKDIEHIGVYGFSLGANMVLQAAAQDEAIEAVVADGASPVVLSDFPLPRTVQGWLYLTYDLVYWPRLEAVTAEYGGLSAMSNRDAVRAIAPRPLLLIAAGKESSGFEPSVVEGLYNVAKDTSQYWLIEDVYHGGGISAHADEYLERVLALFDAAW